MDTSDSQDDSDDREGSDQSEAPLKDSSHLDDEHVTQGDSNLHPIASSPPSFQQRKWNRLRKYYYDQYLELFKSTFQSDEDTQLTGGLPITQLGAVVWHPDEKDILYRSICRKGRHDLPALAGLLGSKSVVEVKAYLDNLREQETDRQRFEAQPKNVSHAEIPAAIEIGAECEATLDRVADALLAFQEQYDSAARRQANDFWLVDHAAAKELDRRADETLELKEVDDPDSEDESLSLPERAFTLFRLSTFLDLSERFFMNKGVSSSESWQNLAEPGERPSLTLDCVTSLYDLIVNFLRRLLQSCIFITQSRIRASTSQDYRPSRIIKSEDIDAALDVLGVNKDMELYWVGLARRNGLTIVDDSHRRGIDSTVVLAYNEVEEVLSQPGKSRSVSVASGALTGEDRSSDERLDSSESTERKDDLSDGSEEDESDVAAEETLSREEFDDNHTQGSQTEDDTSEAERRPRVRVPRHRRLRALEAEQDEYLEKMDQGARQQEESQLLSLFGPEEDARLKGEEMDDIGVRPAQPRKSVEDSMGWTISYEAEWESRAKRRKLNDIVPM